MHRGNWRLWVIAAATALGFAVPIFLRSLPPSAAISAWAVIASCPPLLLSATVDLSWLAIVLVIAPLNAVLYAVAAGTLTLLISRGGAPSR